MPLSSNRSRKIFVFTEQTCSMTVFAAMDLFNCLEFQTKKKSGDLSALTKKFQNL